jgi:dipeptidyl aminopeptidase/acylaminoacyl peptidase
MLRKVPALTIPLVMLILVACGSQDASPPSNDSTPEPETEALPASKLLLLDWGSSTLRPIDSATGQDLPGYEPFDMGHWATSLNSPDGQMLAAVIGPTQEASSGRLHLFDLDAWRETFQLDEPTGSIHPFAWSPDSARLFAVAEKQLWVVDVHQEAARPLADFDFWMDDLKVSPDGETLYLFAFDQSDPTAFMVRGDPFLVAVDADTGKIEGQVALPGVLVGKRHEEGPDGEFYAVYLPARAMSSDGSRYYIVHPDSDQVTIVDLENMAVEQTVEVATRQSPLERLGSSILGLVLSSAEAKGGLNVGRQALLSPDGRWLYITGVEDAAPDIPPNGRKPLGLKVVDTQTMDVVYEEESIGSIALSPDGRWLFGTGWAYEYTQVAANEFKSDDFQGWGLKVIDARSPALVAHINPDGIYEQMAVSADGRYVYLVAGAWAEEAGRNQGRCSTPCQLINVFDVEGRQVVAERQISSFSAELISSYDGR